MLMSRSYMLIMCKFINIYVYYFVLGAVPNFAEFLGSEVILF